jgi:hypothetical protein
MPIRLSRCIMQIWSGKGIYFIYAYFFIPDLNNATFIPEGSVDNNKSKSSVDSYHRNEERYSDNNDDFSNDNVEIIQNKNANKELPRTARKRKPNKQDNEAINSVVMTTSNRIIGYFYSYCMNY